MKQQDNTERQQSKILLAKEYFNLRLLHEGQMQELKNQQFHIKKELLAALKKCKNISKKRIDTAITVYKSFALKESITVYDFIINGLERSFLRHYENNKEAIIQYIDGIFKLRSEIEAFRKVKNKEINIFKKKNSHLNFIILSHFYTQLSTSLKTYETIKSVQEYESSMFEYSFMQAIVDEYFINETAKIEKVRREKYDTDKNRKENEKIYLDAFKDMFNLDKTKRDQQKDEIYSILNDIMSGYAI